MKKLFHKCTTKEGLDNCEEVQYWHILYKEICPNCGEYIADIHEILAEIYCELTEKE